MNIIPLEFCLRGFPEQYLGDKLVTQSHIIAVLPVHKDGSLDTTVLADNSSYVGIEFKNTDFLPSAGRMQLSHSEFGGLKYLHGVSHARDLHEICIGAVYTKDTNPKLVGLAWLHEDCKYW